MGDRERPVRPQAGSCHGPSVRSARPTAPSSRNSSTPAFRAASSERSTPRSATPRSRGTKAGDPRRLRQLGPSERPEGGCPTQQRQPARLIPFRQLRGPQREQETLLGFSLIYLTGYFTDPPATFHSQLVHTLEDEHERRVLVLGFRGSGKSTLGSLALPLWAALEYPEKYPFIILIADSSRQATLNISAIKHELETNTLIKQDYGEIKRERHRGLQPSGRRRGVAEAEHRPFERGPILARPAARR